MAIQLFHACIEKTDAFITEQFFYFYDVLQKSEHEFHLGIYLKMRIEKIAFINGSRKNQLEIIDILGNDITRGYGNNYTQSIKDKIEHIRCSIFYY